MANRKIKPLPSLTQKDTERFYAKVNRHPGQGPTGDCWQWRGACFQSGYGTFGYAANIFRTHRIAYFLATGDDPLDLNVLHHCDNRSCCNPSHLWKGTDVENVRDRDIKGRTRAGSGDRHRTHTHPETIARGERNPMAKLTADKVREIRQKYATGKYTLLDLAQEYHCKSQGSLSAIINRKKWRHIK